MEASDSKWLVNDDASSAALTGRQALHFNTVKKEDVNKSV